MDERPEERSTPSNTGGALVTNLTGVLLYRCGNCSGAFGSSMLLKEHLVPCVKNEGAKPYRCYHCPAAVRNIDSLLEHMRKHGEPKFECSLCQRRFTNSSTLRTHLRDQHKVLNMITQRIGGSVANVDQDIYIVKPVSKHWKTKRTSTDNSGGAAVVEEAAALLFSPGELANVPRQAIFSQEVKCSVCGFKTKVRTNFVRHLEFHQKDIAVPVSGPVNPVPCLAKNEKMFDKMINLAFASNAGRMGAKKDPGAGGGGVVPVEPEKFALSQEDIDEAPVYIEARNRYVCGADNCNYLTHDDSMLRSHLQTFHTDEKTYLCVHCTPRMELANEKSGVSVDHVLKHLKLHDLHLYKCAHCKFYHNQRGKVDHHLQIKHPEKAACVHVVRELEEDKNEKCGKRPWRCGICMARSKTRTQIIEHCW